MLERKHCKSKSKRVGTLWGNDVQGIQCGDMGMGQGFIYSCPESMVAFTLFYHWKGKSLSSSLVE